MHIEVSTTVLLGDDCMMHADRIVSTARTTVMIGTSNRREEREETEALRRKDAASMSQTRSMPFSLYEVRALSTNTIEEVGSS